MPATDSFTSSAVAVASTTALLQSGPVGGSLSYTQHGFRINVENAGVYITKASTLGGSQANLSFPLSKSDARELGEALLQVTG